MVKLPQISRFSVSALRPEELWWDLGWSGRSSVRVNQDGGACCPNPEWERGSTLYCFSQEIRAMFWGLFILPSHKSLQGPWFSAASVLAASSPPNRELQVQTLLTQRTQAHIAHPKINHCHPLGRSLTRPRAPWPEAAGEALPALVPADAGEFPYPLSR